MTAWHNKPHKTPLCFLTWGWKKKVIHWWRVCFITSAGKGISAVCHYRCTSQFHINVTLPEPGMTSTYGICSRLSASWSGRHGHRGWGFLIVCMCCYYIAPQLRCTWNRNTIEWKTIVFLSHLSTYRYSRRAKLVSLTSRYSIICWLYLWAWMRAQ